MHTGDVKSGVLGVHTGSVKSGVLAGVGSLHLGPMVKVYFLAPLWLGWVT